MTLEISALLTKQSAPAATSKFMGILEGKMSLKCAIFKIFQHVPKSCIDINQVSFEPYLGND